MIRRMIFAMTARRGDRKPLTLAGSLTFGLLLCSIALNGCGSNGSDATADSTSGPQPAPTTNSPSPTQPALTEAQIETALLSAQAYIQRRELASAQTILEALVAKAPRDVRGVQNLGEVLYWRSLEAHQSGDATSAKELRGRAADVYRNAVEIEPNNAELRYSAGMIMLMDGGDDEALSLFNSAAELEPANHKFPLYAAQILIKQKRLDEAETALRRVLSIDAQQGVAYASLAVIAMERGDFPGAEENIAKARAIEPDNFDFLAQEARIIRRGGQPQRALEMLVSLPFALQARPMIAREVAAAYRDLNQPAKASEAWQRVYKAQQGAAEAWVAAVNAAELLIEAGKRDEAVIWVRQAELLAPQEQQVIDLRKKLADAAPAPG